MQIGHEANGLQIWHKIITVWKDILSSFWNEIGASCNNIRMTDHVTRTEQRDGVTPQTLASRIHQEIENNLLSFPRKEFNNHSASKLKQC
jgi:hypothetical protein